MTMLTTPYGNSTAVAIKAPTALTSTHKRTVIAAIRTIVTLSHITWRDRAVTAAPAPGTLTDILLLITSAHRSTRK